jgi:ketosteroid isomerase-like protein
VPEAPAGAVARSYLAALNGGDPDEIAGLVSEDFVNEHTSVLGSSLVGRDAYRERLPGFLATFQDLHYEIEDVLVDGDRVAVPYTLTASCAGPGGDLRPVRIRGIFRLTVAGGLIAHRVDYWDSGTFLRQIES